MVKRCVWSRKTTIAHELQQKLPNAIFYDPEIIGSALMELVPEEMKENDFQEYQEWRCRNAHLLKRMSKESDGRLLFQ